MNRDSARLPAEIVNLSEVDAVILQKRNQLLLRYGVVEDRMGIEVFGGGDSGEYVQDGLGGGSSGRPMSAYTDKTPMPSPLPSPQFVR